MAYVGTAPSYEKKAKFRPGDWAVTRKKLRCECGYFEKGTKVKVTGIGPHGYDLEDEYGNRMTECGFRCIEKESAQA